MLGCGCVDNEERIFLIVVWIIWIRKIGIIVLVVLVG